MNNDLQPMTSNIITCYNQAIIRSLTPSAYYFLPLRLSVWWSSFPLFLSVSVLLALALALVLVTPPVIADDAVDTSLCRGVSISSGNSGSLNFSIDSAMGVDQEDQDQSQWESPPRMSSSFFRSISEYNRIKFRRFSVKGDGKKSGKNRCKKKWKWILCREIISSYSQSFKYIHHKRKS
jgi:hypothetical protein